MSMHEWRCRPNRKFIKAKGVKHAVRIRQQGTVTYGAGKKRGPGPNNAGGRIAPGLMHGHNFGTMDLGPPGNPSDPAMAKIILTLMKRGMSEEAGKEFLEAKICEARRGGIFAMAWCRVHGILVKVLKA